MLLSFNAKITDKKFFTILIFWIIKLPISSAVGSRWTPFISLLLIAIGTGGIKPCVSAFGGDQFEEHQVITYIARALILVMWVQADKLFTYITLLLIIAIKKYVSKITK